MYRRYLSIVSVLLVCGCGTPDPSVVKSGIEVAITSITMNDGSQDNSASLEVDAVQNPACPGSGDPEVITNAYINMTFRASYVLPEGSSLQQDYNYVHLQSYTITYTPVDAATTAQIPSVTRYVQLDIEIGGQPELIFLFMSLDQKSAWDTAQADFGDFLPKEYNVVVEFTAVDPRQNQMTIKTEKSVTIGSFDNC